MFSLKPFLLALVLVAALGRSTAANACGDYSCESWGGLQELGGYNLSSWGYDLYDIGSSYDYGYDNWGGSCGGVISTCGGGYDSAGLYGSDWGMGYESGYTIDISIYPLGGNQGYSDWTNFDSGCSIGYCDSNSYYPYDGSSWNSYSPWYDPYTNFIPRYPTEPTYNPQIYYPQIPGNSWTSYPIPYNPNYNNYPRDPGFPVVPPPTTYPPTYNMCDNITIPCPTGPITRTQPPLPRNRYDIPRDPNQPIPPFVPPTHNPIDPGYPTYPPVVYPPVTYPPVNYPPTTYPPVNYPPPVVPPTTYPPVNYPPTTYPPVTPPVITPPVNNPPTTYPQNPPPVPGGSTSPGSRPPTRNEIPRG